MLLSLNIHSYWLFQFKKTNLGHSLNPPQHYQAILPDLFPICLCPQLNCFGLSKLLSSPDVSLICCNSQKVKHGSDHCQAQQFSVLQKCLSWEFFSFLLLPLPQCCPVSSLTVPFSCMLGKYYHFLLLLFIIVSVVIVEAW